MRTNCKLSSSSFRLIALISLSYILKIVINDFVLIFSIFSSLTKPTSHSCFLNSVSGIIFSIKVIFLSFSISF